MKTTVLLISVFLAFSLGEDGCCLGPPDSFRNAFGVLGLSKVTSSVGNATATADWWRRVLNFTPSAPFASPFGTVTRLHFDALVVELLETPGSTPTTPRPNPPNHTYYLGFTQFSFRVQDRGVVAARLAANDVPVLFEFPNDQLQLYLQIIRDPTTGTLIEFLQPYDNSSSSVDWDTNPLGILGFNQATLSTPSLLHSSQLYRSMVGTLTPFSTYINLLEQFGTELAIAYAARLRVELIHQQDAVPRPQTTPAPPKQGTLQDLTSFAIAVANVTAAERLLGDAVLYSLSDPSFSGQGQGNVWFRDTVTGVLVEVHGAL